MIVYILSSLIEKIRFSYRKERKAQVKACTKPLLWDRNCNRENNGHKKAYVHIVLNGVIFHKIYMILFHMLDIFYLLRFFFPIKT